MVFWHSSAFKIKNVRELKEVISNNYVVSYIFYTLYGEMLRCKVDSASGFSFQLNSLYKYNLFMCIYCDLNCNSIPVSWIFVLENESKLKSIPFCECVCLCQLHAKEKCSILQKLTEQTVFELIMWRICHYFPTAKNSRDNKFCLLLHYNCYPTPFLHFPIFIHFDTKYKYHWIVEWDTVIELHRTRLHIMLNRLNHHAHHGMTNPKVVNGTDSLHTGGRVEERAKELWIY